MDFLANVSLQFGLTRLTPHLFTFLLSLWSFLAIHQILAPVISGWLSSNYQKMNRRGKNNWSIHVVSQVHALIIVPLALRALDSKALDADRVYGWDDEKSGLAQAVASAYFVWDTLDAIINFTDLGFVVHGLACSAIYLMSFKPFLSYYASRCLLWEASTIFLNIHWFLDKTNRTGSFLQMVNGIFLLVTFFGVRIIYGGMVSYQFFHTLYDVRNEVPVAYLVVYGAGNVVLQALNWLWFTKMITALRNRFPSKGSTELLSANGKIDAKKE